MANAKQLEILERGVTAWNEWRSQHPEARIDLSQADLKQADLRAINLSQAKLSLAELSGAKLNASDLEGAKLDAADLSGVNFRLANLSNADLLGADLKTANLSTANLTGASLAHAVLLETTFALTSLETVKELETCEHHGPSSIDYHTLIESGPLPEVFLRGCGLSDDYIGYWRVFWSQPIQFYSCFISYSHADKVFARRLHDTLQGRGIRCWLDEHQILPGDLVHQAVDEGIRVWDKVLLCCSKQALTSWWVDKEIQKALMKEERLSKERGKEVLSIIPLNLDDFMFNPIWKDWKQQHLISRFAPDFTDWERDNAKFDEQLERVVKALRADGGARERPPKPLL